MTDKTQPTEKKGNRPTHTVFVKTYVDGNPRNIKAGVAWKHSKGNGFNISLNDMVVFENKPREENPKNTVNHGQPRP